VLRQRKLYGIKLGKVWRIPEAELEKSLTKSFITPKQIKRTFNLDSWISLDLKGVPKDCKFDRNFIYSDAEQDI